MKLSSVIDVEPSCIQAKSLRHLQTTERWKQIGRHKQNPLRNGTGITTSQIVKEK